MQAIRDIVSRDVFKDYEVPEEFGDEFEMILIPINNIETDKDESQILMKQQSENGFSKSVLAQESEDVWNDI